MNKKTRMLVVGLGCILFVLFEAPPISKSLSISTNIILFLSNAFVFLYGADLIWKSIK